MAAGNTLCGDRIEALQAECGDLPMEKRKSE